MKLKICFYDLQGGVLLLTGPSGCGKTTTVRVLAQELSIRIQEWTNSSNMESYSSSSQYGKNYPYIYGHPFIHFTGSTSLYSLYCAFDCPFFFSEFRMNGLAYSSQSTQFREFLLRANKYNWLKIVGDDGTTDKKLILVEVCNLKYNSSKYSVR